MNIIETLLEEVPNMNTIEISLLIMLMLHSICIICLGKALLKIIKRIENP